MYYKGLVLFKNNQSIEAKKVCATLINTFPDFLDAHYLKGLIFLFEKSYNSAVDEFTLVINKNRKHLMSLFNRSSAYGLIENYNKSIEDLNTCVSLKPLYSQAYYWRAYWNEYLGNHKAAIKDYETTINIDTKNYEAYISLAHIYKNQKNNAKACDVINNSIKSGSQISQDLKDNFCK